jgi:hypothetical protein
MIIFSGDGYHPIQPRRHINLATARSIRTDPVLSPGHNRAVGFQRQTVIPLGSDGGYAGQSGWDRISSTVAFSPTNHCPVRFKSQVITGDGDNPYNPSGTLPWPPQAITMPSDFKARLPPPAATLVK